MTQTVTETASKTASELERGKASLIILKTDGGYILIKPISPDIHLVIMTSRSARLGKLLILLDKIPMLWDKNSIQELL